MIFSAKQNGRLYYLEGGPRTRHQSCQIISFSKSFVIKWGGCNVVAFKVRPSKVRPSEV